MPHFEWSNDAGSRSPSRRRAAAGVMLVAAALCAFTSPVLGQSLRSDIDARIAAFGFRAGAATPNVVREGQWIPILTELTLTSGTQFQGELRVECVDLDGDLVTFTEKPIVLTAGVGPKRVWCYGIAHEDVLAAGGAPRQTPRVTLHDEDGTLVARLPLPAVDLLSNDRVLILDLSDRPVTRLRTLAGTGTEPNSPIFGEERGYYRPIVVGSAPSDELPERGWALESVDVIVWDEPNPDRASPAQLDALREWVRAGGQFVIGLGSSWQRVQKSPLAELLPFKPATPAPAPTTADTAGTIAVTTLPRFFERFGDRSLTNRAFDPPIAVVSAQPARGTVTVWERDADRPMLNLVTIDYFGSGRVVTVAGSIRELSGPTAGDLFLRELFDLPRIKPELVKNESDRPLPPTAQRLYDRLTQKIDFRQVGGLFIVAATAFVIGYIAVATLGSWWWLRKHALTHLSWSVFAGFAVVASVLSVLTVMLAQGIASRVDSVCLVDAQAGDASGRADCWFGLRTARQPRADLALPGPTNYVRGLTRAAVDAAVYATPQRYEGLAARATLLDAPLRATLKQFEGHWSGELGGAIRAQIAVDARGRVEPASWIKNDLTVRLLRGYLLFVDPRVARDGFRPTLLTRDYRGRANVAASNNVLVLELPALAPGERIVDLGKKEYEKFDTSWAAWSRNPEGQSEPALPTLFKLHQDWASMLGIWVTALGAARDSAADAALLLSTRNLYLHCTENDDEQLGLAVTTTGLVDCDVSHWLTTTQGVLLLLSDEPGPAALHVGEAPLRSRAGLSLFRVRVPIEVRGAAAGVAP
ncbi:MAG: hypothetical protein AB7Q17_18385 [Phycisphaerae bacterium]